MPIDKQRIGRFSISGEMVDDQPEVVMQVLREVVVLRAEAMHHTKSIEYIGRSEHFDVLPENGTEVPEYNILCHQKDGEPAEFEWVRAE